MVYTHYFELYTVVLTLIDNGKAIIIQLPKVEHTQEFAILGVKQIPIIILKNASYICIWLPKIVSNSL